MLVELLGLLVECMNEQRTNARVLRYVDGSIDCILQHGRTQFDALRPSIHNQPAKHHDRYRIRHIATNRAGRQLVSDCARCHGIKATHAIFFIHDYECSAGATDLVGHCSTLKPLIQGVFTALKIIQQMRVCKWLRCG